MSENEGSVRVAVFVRNGILARNVVVTLQTLGGTAVGGFHFIEPVPCSGEQSSMFFIPQSIAGMDFQHVSFDPTFNASSPAQTVTVPILDDMTLEDFEYFSLVLMSNDPAVTLNPVAANITVVDDLDSTLKPLDLCNTAAHVMHSFPVTVITIGFSPATYSVHEDAGSIGLSVEVLNGTLARSVMVTFLTAAGGTAMGKSLW